MKNILFIMADQLRFDYLGCYGHPDHPHPAHRRARGARRALRAGLRPVADLRSEPDELLHRAVRPQPRRDLERRSAPGRRDDPRRPPAPARHADGALRQDPHAGRPRRHGAARPRPRERGGSAGRRMRVRRLGPARRPPPGPVCPPPSHYQDHLRGLGYDGPNPWEQWANSAAGEDGEILSGWLLRHADKAGAHRREGQRDPLRDDPRHRVHRAGGRRAVVPAP